MFIVDLIEANDDGDDDEEYVGDLILFYIAWFLCLYSIFVSLVVFLEIRPFFDFFWIMSNRPIVPRRQEFIL